MKLDEWVKTARAYKRWTQKRLGDEIGVTKANVSGWENGRHRPSFPQLQRISDLTGYPLLSHDGRHGYYSVDDPLPLHENEPELLAGFRLLDQQDREDVMARVRQLVLAKHKKTQDVMAKLGIDRRADDTRVFEALGEVPKTPSRRASDREQLLNPLPQPASHGHTKKHRP